MRPSAQHLLRSSLARVVLAPVLELLGIGLAALMRFDRSLGCLRHALRAYHRAVDRARVLVKLGDVHLLRFAVHRRRGAQLADLDQAIDQLEEARAIAGTAWSWRDTVSLARARHLRYLLHGHRHEDVDEAIIGFGSALTGTPASNERRQLQAQLGQALRERFLDRRQPRDLEEAIALLREVHNTFPADHPGRRMHTWFLAECLQARFDLWGARNDLTDATAVARAALTGRFRMLGDVTSTLTMYVARGEVDLALRTSFAHLVARKAELFGATDEELVDALAILADQHYSALGDRWPGIRRDMTVARANLLRTRPTDWGDDAVSLLDTVPATVRDARYWRFLALTRLDLFAVQHTMAELDAAIDAVSRGLQIASAADAGTLSALAGHLRVLRHHHNPTLEDRDIAVTQLRAAVDDQAASVDTRVWAASRLGELGASTGDAAVASEGYCRAVELLPLLAWRGLRRPDHERLLARYLNVAVDATATALLVDVPSAATERLEHGRCVIWGLQLQLRSELTDLAQTHPAIAQRLAEIRKGLDT